MKPKDNGEKLSEIEETLLHETGCLIKAIVHSYGALSKKNALGYGNPNFIVVFFDNGYKIEVLPCWWKTEFKTPEDAKTAIRARLMDAADTMQNDEIRRGGCPNDEE
jgi:hypothetical protein